MNKVILMGRLTRDPDVRYTQGEQAMAIARFSLAVDRRIKRDGEASADFINCVAFGKTGEFIERYAHQGTKLVVEGRIQTGSYTNKDGVKVYTTDIILESCEFAESKAAGQRGTQTEQQGRQTSTDNYPTDADGFMNIPDGVEEGLPFA